MRKVRKLSKEHKDKIRKARIGKKHTMETKLIISRKNKGKTGWNKGLTKYDHPAIAKAVENLGDYAIKGKTLGDKGSNWKGGVIKSGGYFYVYNKELGKHFGGKYIKRANYNWYKEKGEMIKPPIFLHHINNDRTDDRVENLMKINLSIHSEHHFKELVRDEKGRVVSKHK